MKKHVLFALIIVVFLSSCGSITSFESPNNFRNITGTLFLTNGKSIDGKLVVQPGQLFSSDVKIYATGEKNAMHFDLGEVEGYRIRNDYYALKEKRVALSFGTQSSFMKRLTPEHSRIHLYEDLEKITETTNVNGTNTTTTRYETEYYIQLPDDRGFAVYPVGGSKFVPHFDEKMSRMVQDCPALSQKIAAKQSGYFYAQIGLFKEKRADVLLNIIREYNNCGNSASAKKQIADREM